ncbi:MAG: hypothetical protein QOH95_745 [Gaiellaceae bacterium]|jgi:hypothetical protein|nr:hypothetical protein [Gaiellaceae bacterium]
MTDDKPNPDPAAVDGAEVEEQEAALLPPRDLMSVIRVPGEQGGLPPPELPPDLG